MQKTQMSQCAWFNGEVVALETGAPSIASINFHLGTSVFDGLAAYWNRDHYYLHRAEEHVLRFIRGAERMGLSFPWTAKELLRGIETLLAAEPQGTQYVRPIAYRRAPELWITGSEGKPVDVSIFTVAMPRDIDSTLRCHVSPIERISSLAIPGQTKVSGAYVNSFNARKTAEKMGFQDGIMLDRSGRVSEASAANVFLITDGQLLTPALNEDIFPGVTREVIIDLARRLGIRCTQKELFTADLRQAEGVFFCSTLMEIRGLSCLDERLLATAELPLFRALVHAFRELTHQ